LSRDTRPSLFLLDPKKRKLEKQKLARSQLIFFVKLNSHRLRRFPAVRVGLDRSVIAKEMTSRYLRVAASLLALEVHAWSNEAPASWRLRERERKPMLRDGATEDGGEGP